MHANGSDQERGWNWKPALCLVFLTAFGLVSCLFETKEADPDRPGYLNLELMLKPNPSALFKTASADTVFRLDSVIIILTANGAAAITNTYVVTGRSDSGNITLTTKTYALAPLRTWKAKILSIDTTLNPTRRDTVHIDSVSFTINPGDTAFVSKTVNPVFSILRARLVSNSPGSLTNNVKYLRIRVDGATRDSTVIGPNLHWIDFGNSNTGCAVGDSGTIIRTTNSGANWAAASSGTAQNLFCVSFPSTNNGWAVGAAGTVVHTTSGTSWATVASGTTQNLNGTNFTGSNNGWAVGDSGTIIKTTNGSSFVAEASGTTKNLASVWFSSASNGNAVGAGGTILRSTNGGASWSAQASGTTANLSSVFFPAAAIGYVVGDGGVILKTSNSGATWTALTSGTSANLNAVFFVSNTEGYVAGDGGVLLTTTDGSTWTARSSGTTQNLGGVAWTGNGSAGAAVGNLGSVSTTTNGIAFTHQLIGTKSFDVQLTYKYFTPNVTHTLLMDAVDTTAGALRGYQASKSILLTPGKDSTVSPNSSMAKCGYSGIPACTP